MPFRKEAERTPCHASKMRSVLLLLLYQNTLIERDLRSSLHALGVLVESAIGLVALFLNSGAILHQFLWNVLVCGLEDVDKSAGKVLLGFAEEGDGETILSGTTGTAMMC